MPTARDHLVTLAVACGLGAFFALIVGLLSYSFVLVGGERRKVPLQMHDRLQNAWDSRCTLSSSPGTALTKKLNYSCGGEDHRCNKPALHIECLASLGYAAAGDHPSGSAKVLVNLGLDFLMKKTPEVMCDVTLAGTWPNMRILNSGQSKGSVSDLDASLEWQCGDMGWIGCKAARKYYEFSEQCQQHFGFPRPDLSEMAGFTYVHFTDELDKCPIAKDGSQTDCSIDEYGQVRLGSTKDLLLRLQSEIQSVESANHIARAIFFFFWIVSFCCLLGGCVIYFKSSLGRKRDFND